MVNPGISSIFNLFFLYVSCGLFVISLERRCFESGHFTGGLLDDIGCLEGVGKRCWRRARCRICVWLERRAMTEWWNRALDAEVEMMYKRWQKPTYIYIIERIYWHQGRCMSKIKSTGEMMSSLKLLRNAKKNDVTSNYSEMQNINKW